ncbi:hypothetical protein CBL_03526 [Carabus blaptoides fortunei]
MQNSPPSFEFETARNFVSNIDPLLINYKALFSVIELGISLVPTAPGTRSFVRRDRRSATMITSQRANHQESEKESERAPGSGGCSTPHCANLYTRDPCTLRVPVVRASYNLFKNKGEINGPSGVEESEVVLRAGESSDIVRCTCVSYQRKKRER